MSKRTIVIGDIHGAYRALRQVLERANYTPDDRLILLGDYIDGYPESFEVCDYILALRNSSIGGVETLLGNHDDWFSQVLSQDMYLMSEASYIKEKYRNWWTQGGESTYRSFMSRPEDKRIQLRNQFFKNLQLYKLEDNVLYVHGGFFSELGAEGTLTRDWRTLIWDRDLYKRAVHLQSLLDKSTSKPKEEKWRFGGYDRIYIGHTHTTSGEFHAKEIIPKLRCNIVNLDQGCGYGYKLTAWVHETGEYFQSDLVTDLYPEHGKSR